MKIRFSYCFVFSMLFLFIDLEYVTVGAALTLAFKPHPSDLAGTARWLISQSDWGVLNTISIELRGAPFGNVASFSDGPPGGGRGVPYFYLTTLDPTARNAIKDERASLTVSEYPIGTCGKLDPENPVCAKLTLTGKLKKVDDDNEVAFARMALLEKHTEISYWPEDHMFKIYKLDIEDVFLIDWYGGRLPLTPDEYLHPKL